MKAHSLLKVALTLGQVGVMGFVQTLWAPWQPQSQDPKSFCSQDCSSTCPSLKLSQDQTLFKECDCWVCVFFFGWLVGFFLLQKDINTIHSILLDESECETIYFGQPNMLSSSLFLLENFGLSTSSIPQGASFLAAEKSSKNLQSSLYSDFRKKSLIKSVICAMCFLLLGWQSFCIFKEFSKLCVHRHTLNLDVLLLNTCLPSLR